MEHHQAATAAATEHALAAIPQEMIYVMGISFILGSLFTVAILWTLDFIRRNKSNDVGA